MKWILCEETTILLPAWEVEEEEQVGQSVSSGPPRSWIYSSLLPQSASLSQVTISISHVLEGLLGALKSALSLTYNIPQIDHTLCLTETVVPVNMRNTAYLCFL